MEFKVLAQGGNELVLIDANHVGDQLPRLPFSKISGFQASFGKLLFQHYYGSGFNIWFSNYLIIQETKLIGKANIPVLELHIQFDNGFNIEWDGAGKNELRPFQFNLTYTPFVNNRADFRSGRNCHTFDVHFCKHYLAKLSAHFPALNSLLEKVEKEQATQLAPRDHFLTPEMIRIIHNLLNCPFAEGPATFYIEAKVMELLLLALDRVVGTHPAEELKLSEYDKDCLHEARTILLSDFEAKITLVGLARKVGINDFKLKKGFKQLFGSTVFDYLQNAKMQNAAKLLLNTTLAVEEIAYAVGYEYVANFNAAFKKHFGCTPGQYKKLTKR